MEKDKKLDHLTSQLARLNPQNRKLIATITAQLKASTPPAKAPAAPKTLRRKIT
jgi:hypothetical protein